MIHSKDYVTNLDESCIQPNAVDLRISKLFRLDPDTLGVVTEKTKKFVEREPVLTLGGFYYLTPGVYEVETEHEVEIPEGAAGWLVIRSTFARNGVLLGNGLYDSGYKGIIGGTIHVSCPLKIERNTRFAQFIMTKSNSSHLYDGHYNQTRGVTIDKAS